METHSNSLFSVSLCFVNPKKKREGERGLGREGERKGRGGDRLERDTSRPTLLFSKIYGFYLKVGERTLAVIFIFSKGYCKF